MASHRALFISDVHLGTRTSKAELLLDFLERNDAETIYLVGDIVDFWRLRRGGTWPESHNAVLRKLLAKAHNGARVIFIPGNHDEGLRQYCGSRFGRIEIVRDAVHETANGRRYLIMHGDEYDVVIRHARWLAFLGDRGYATALALNVPLNWARGRLGLEYWSLAAYLKQRAKSAVNHIGDFERALVQKAESRQVDGVICGHIHHAGSRWFGKAHYLNIGDWVESCTAVAEAEDGELRIIFWLEEGAGRARDNRELTALEAAA
jgi:UDP-2,3-diacylglucosamine pyrophosphatase LpxH